TDALERKLYIIRKSSGHAIQALRLQHGKEVYVPSMSARTLCGKGMLLADQVGEYYLDLKDARVESALALVQQRFSTNTFAAWDRPSTLAFTAGRQFGATLDRNALRPSPHVATPDDLAIMGSECGCLPEPEERIVKKWRLQPGKMFLVDLEKGRIIDDKELKDSLASARPYAEWIERIRVKLDEVESDKTTPIKSKVRLLDRQQAFAYTQEDLKFIMQPMAAAG